MLTTLAIIIVNDHDLQLSYAQSEQDPIFQERILNYKSEILVNKDASLRVAETITVKKTGQEIQPGIYREFSLDSPFRPGNIKLNVLDVLRDGKSVYYSLQNRGDTKRINIDNRNDINIDSGIYTYTIEYKTDQRLDFSNPEMDQLLWNVTGKGWSFPIDQVRAKVLLPEAIPEDKLTLNAFAGDNRNSYNAKLDAGGNPTLITTRPLEAQEDFQIIVKFPKGYVDRPQSWQILYWQFANFLETAIPYTLNILMFLLIISAIFILIPLLFWHGRPSNFFD